MYLHLGQNTVENSSLGKSTRRYLSEAEKQGKVVNVSMELPKSFVVCEEREGTKVYISQISSATLRKRTGYIEEISNIK